MTEKIPDAAAPQQNADLQRILEEEVLGTSKDEIVIRFLELLGTLKLAETTAGIREMENHEILDRMRRALCVWNKTHTPPRLEVEPGIFAPLLELEKDLGLLGDEKAGKPYLRPGTEKLLHALLFVLEFIWDFSFALLKIIRETRDNELSPATEEKPLAHCFETIASVRSSVDDLFSDLRLSLQQEEFHPAVVLPGVHNLEKEITALLQGVLGTTVERYIAQEPCFEEDRPDLACMASNLSMRALALDLEYQLYHLRRASALDEDPDVRRTSARGLRRLSVAKRALKNAEDDPCATLHDRHERKERVMAALRMQ